MQITWGPKLAAPRHNSSGRWFESLSIARAPLLRLFCFPYGGGNAYAFREWQRHFAPEIDLCLVHLPGRARRISERPHTRLQPLVEEMADAIRTEIRGRFAFYGHSMGALISFELARELRRRRYGTPVHLFLSACRAPNVVRSVPPTFNLPIQEFVAEIQKLKGTPKEFFEHPELQNALLPLLRADFEITDTYEYLAESPLACPITVYGGEQDELAPVKNLVPWELQTSAECTIRVFSGHHFFIQSHKTEFVELLRKDVLNTIALPTTQLSASSTSSYG
jgi:medium-chain acyl-[acyl-carrier-protein] hydrolase